MGILKYAPIENKKVNNMKIIDLSTSIGNDNISSKVIYLSLISVILIFSIFINPDKISLSTCAFKDLTGHSCLTCGLSRSLYAVSHLHIIESFGFHLMGPFVFFFLLFFFLKFSIEIITGREILFNVNSIVKKTGIVLFASLWLVFWAVRFLSES